MIIEQRFHRTIIGAKGEKIREIRDKYPEVQISFPDAGKKSDVVNLRGPREGVDSVYTFLKKLNAELVRIVSTLHPFEVVGDTCRLINAFLGRTEKQRQNLKINSLLSFLLRIPRM